METKKEIEEVLGKMILVNPKRSGNTVFYLSEIHENKGVEPPSGYHIVFLHKSLIKSDCCYLGGNMFID
jgi:hypothetical protein